MKTWFFAFSLIIFVALSARPFHAQEVRHPDMELITDDRGEEIVVEVATQRPPNPNLYEVREEEGAKGQPILAVYYRPTDELVVFFSRTVIKGKVEGPGLTLFFDRYQPEIEKVIGQKSYEKDIKRRYLDLIWIDKGDLVDAGPVNVKEVDQMLKKRRN
jgi:hypothetical protein